MKTFALLSMLLGFMNFSNAETKSTGVPVYLNYCMNIGQGVSFGYQSCVNMNFSTISRVVNGFFPTCSNYGTEVDYFYTDCINRNFREAQRALNNTVYLSPCSNYDRTTLDGFFIMCVNQNFQTISRALGDL